MTPTGSPTETGLRSFGRRHGRKLRDAQQALLDDLMPGLTVDMTAGTAGGALDPAALFGKLAKQPLPRLWLEVGFGGGEHLCAQAAAHPEVCLIGCEPFMNGVVSALQQIRRDGLTNIRLHPDDARPLMDRLPAGSVDRVFILFPDPWPKMRHNKRRFIQRENLDRVARLLPAGGELRIASDHMDYVRWILHEIAWHQAFEWQVQGPEDWRQRPADWPETRYERKARAEGIAPVFLRYRRR